MTYEQIARGGDQPKFHLRHSPPLSPEMRLTLKQFQDDAYEAGVNVGRAEVEREYYGNGIISLAIGAALGAGGFWFIAHVILR